jgi:hypothetical protein
MPFPQRALLRGARCNITYNIYRSIHPSELNMAEEENADGLKKHCNKLNNEKQLKKLWMMIPSSNTRIG